MSIINLQTLKLTTLATFGLVAWLALTPDFITEPVAARPKFMKLYNADKFAKKELQNNCTVCHIGKGGGENTYLGEDYAAANYQFTQELRGKYPTFFNKKPKGKK